MAFYTVNRPVGPERNPEPVQVGPADPAHIDLPDPPPDEPANVAQVDPAEVQHEENPIRLNEPRQRGRPALLGRPRGRPPLPGRGRGAPPGQGDQRPAVGEPARMGRARRPRARPPGRRQANRRPQRNVLGKDV